VPNLPINLLDLTDQLGLPGSERLIAQLLVVQRIELCAQSPSHLVVCHWNLRAGPGA
jgi:hypothetical protein